MLFLDQIPEADKPALYAAATAFAWPSRYEGFGPPPLEAMASGTPVLCSTSSSLPEVTGHAAIALHPDDVDGGGAWPNRPLMPATMGSLNPCLMDPVTSHVLHSVQQF